VARIFELLEEIHAQGITILLVEQNAHLALQIADRGYVLESGEIVLEDDAKKLLGNEAVRKAYLGED
jgi:branched-chain amino acid transport system ATP-binding protein